MMSRLTHPFQAPPTTAPQHSSSLRSQPRYTTGVRPADRHHHHHHNNHSRMMPPQSQQPYHTNQQYLQQSRRDDGDVNVVVMTQQQHQQSPSDWDYSTNMVPHMYPATHPQMPLPQQQPPSYYPPQSRVLPQTHAVDEPIIELSERQQQMLLQRRQQQQQHAAMDAAVPLPSFPNRSNVPTYNNNSLPPPPAPQHVSTNTTVRQPPPQYSEPWDKPCVVTQLQQQQSQLNLPVPKPIIPPPPQQQQQQQPLRTKSLYQSVMNHPVQRHHSSPTSQRNSPEKRSIDPPATKNNTTTTSSTMAEPMEEQKKKLRGLLLQKHSPRVTTAHKRVTSTRSGTSQSTHHSSTGSNNSTRRSPQTMLQRVLQTASKAAISPKQLQPSSRPKLVPSKKPVSTTHPTAVVAAAPSPSLRDQMRQRLLFTKKPQLVVVDTEPETTSIQVPTTALESSNTNYDATPTTTTMEGYETFVQSLIHEISGHHHSELYASFVVAIDPTQNREEILHECMRLSPKSRRDVLVDVGIIQRLNEHLKEQPISRTLVRPATQLMNDKQYRKVMAKRQSKKVVSEPELPPPAETTKMPQSSSTVIPSKSHTKPRDYEDEVWNSRSTDSSQHSTVPSWKPPTDSLPRKSEPMLLSVEIPTSHSSDSSTNDTSPTTSSTTMAETMESSSISLSRTQTTNHDTTAAAVVAKHSEPETTWNRIQLRTVQSNDSYENQQLLTKANSNNNNNNNVAPEWASITLRPVSCRSEIASSATSTTTTSESKSMLLPHRKDDRMETCEKLTMDEIMETENVTMIRLKEEIINCCGDDGNGSTGIESRVVIGETLIRHIQYDAVDMTAPVTVLWTLPRHEMEPDGITINMSNFKITLMLRNHRLSRKVLSFETSEDCLRFATAFYNMPFHSKPSAELLSTAPMIPLNDTTKQVQLDHPVVESAHTTPIPTQDTAPIVIIDTLISKDVTKTEQPLNQEEQVVLEKYRELRLTKHATDALLETIALQQSKYTEIRGVKTAALPSNVDAAIGSLPSSPISTFTATTVGGGSSGDHQPTTVMSTSDTPQWTDDETKLIEKYRLMIRRGVPADAVRHKMTLDQVDVKISAFLFPNDDKVAGVEQNETKRKAVESELSEAENAIAEKYRKMLKLRIPVDAVQHKMVQEQVDAKIVAAVLGQEYVPKQQYAPIQSTNVASSTNGNTSLSDEEESVAMQYRKLLKINVSKDALLSRMKQEGVNPKIIIAILGQNALQVSSGNDGGKGGSTSGSTGSKMISINWDLTENALEGSVWDYFANSELPPMDFKKLKEMFQRKEQKQKDMKNIDPTNGIGKAKLLDITRSNNVAISLKAFKEFTHAELSEIIRFLDPIRKIRGERTNFIRDLLPTLTEVKLVNEYTGADDRLVPAELWFRHLRGIQRIERKARVIRTMEMFTSDAVEVRDNFRLLADVCRQVMASTKLQDVLGMVLRIGNVMNEGTRNGRAAGFKFNSLLRLTQTKTADGKITVLDYLVSVFAEKSETDTLDLISDFPDCHKVSRFLISDMSNEVKSLKENLEQCKLELLDLEREQNPPKEPKEPPKTDTRGAMVNPHSLLFASILARAGGDNETDASLPTTRKSTESFTKRDEFLAAIKNKNDAGSQEVCLPIKEQSCIDDEQKNDELTSATFENTLAGGIMRLRKFIEVVEGSFVRLEKTRVDALAACKDLSRYCGESGGVGVTISLLDVLSQFTKNLEDAVRKYQDQQLNEARKLRIQEAKEVNSVKSDGSIASLPKDRKSVVFALSDFLKNANLAAKEDFKKGFVMKNPSESLKVVYEHEQRVAAMTVKPRLDIVSAIQQRGETVNDEEIEKARSTFAGVQALLLDSSPRELAIDQISSFPFSSSDSHSECTMSNDGGSIAMDPNESHSTTRPKISLLDAVKNEIMSSKENVRNATPKDTDNGEIKGNGFCFDIQSSQDRLRSRRSLSPSNVQTGSLANVMKSLDEIKQQSPSKKIPALMLPSAPRSVERKSISERAREKRSEKRPNHGSLLAPVVVAKTATMLTEANTAHVTSLSARSPTLLMLDRQRQLTSMKEEEDMTLTHPEDDTLPDQKRTDASSFARLARQKRIQKRMSK